MPPPAHSQSSQLISHRETRVRPNAATTPNSASAVAAPNPDTSPDSWPSKIVRRRHRMPTGPTGTAITTPTTMPFTRNSKSIWVLYDGHLFGEKCWVHCSHTGLRLVAGADRPANLFRAPRHKLAG